LNTPPEKHLISLWEEYVCSSFSILLTQKTFKSGSEMLPTEMQARGTS
jgi:hypothetical protein